MKHTLTLGSLFDGSGGFPLGAKLCGIKPVWSSEIEPFPIRVTTKRLPEVAHYGDVSKLDGAKLSPVDIVTFGSPCQDMSIAGNRTGLRGSKSCLFYEAVRIVKEMREATCGHYPRFAVWENVQGAFTSNKGEDFRCVLESLACVKEPSAHVPMPEKGKWRRAGSIVGDGYSIAWRSLDAQYWGVPQRRRRIYLVADFGGECAGKVLFESEGLSGYSAARFGTWQRTAATLKDSIGAEGTICLNDQGGSRMDVSETVVGTLRAKANHPPIVLENHPSDSRIQIKEDGIVQTLTSHMGTGGNNVPLVAEESRCFDVRFTSEGTRNARQNCYETQTSRTIDTNRTSPDSNQGGIAVVAVQGSMIGRELKNGPNGSGIGDDISFTLNTVDRHAVAYGIDYAAFNCGKNARFGISIEHELEPTMVAKGANAVAQKTDVKYIVRRLTPTECARLQGFPDWWCGGLESENPTDEEIAWWDDVFRDYARVMGTKPKSRSQIVKWLKILTRIQPYIRCGVTESHCLAFGSCWPGLRIMPTAFRKSLQENFTNRLAILCRKSD